MDIAKNTTILNKKTLEAFQNQEILKKSWFIALCGLLLAVLGFGIQNGHIILKSIPFLVIGLAVCPLYIILLKILFISQNKKFTPATLNYVFTDEKILVSAKSETTDENTEMTYSQLEKIRYTKKYIFLYINKVSALVVDKNTFSTGSADKLIDLIKLKFPNKLSFIPKKK